MIKSACEVCSAILLSTVGSLICLDGLSGCCERSMKRHEIDQVFSPDYGPQQGKGVGWIQQDM